MSRLGLVNFITTYSTRVASVVKSFWEDKFDLWEAMGDVWEQQN